MESDGLTSPIPFGTNPPGCAVEPCPEPTRDLSQYWIEIQLLGEDGSPIQGEQYQIELPNGDVARGFLDSRGIARVENIPQEGNCRINFPGLDKEAWEPW